MDLKDIKAIIDLMKKNSISEFEMEKQDFKIKLKRGMSGGMVQYDDCAPGNNIVMQSGMLPSSGQQALPPFPVAVPATNEQEIKSPMIGTFYRAPSPESAPYVEVGTEVQPDSVICIIEAMKVMNEIKAEARGVVTQISIENGKPVEFGQALFKIRPL